MNSELPKVESLKKIRLKEGDVLLVEVDIGALPTNRANEFLAQVREHVKQALGNVRCMVIPLHRVRVSVLNVEDAVIKEMTMKDEIAKAEAKK